MYLYLEMRRYVQIGRLGIVGVIRSQMRWPELVARITAMLHNVLVGKPEIGRTGNLDVDGEVSLKRMLNVVAWMDMTQNMDHWQALVKATMMFWVL